MHHGTDDRRRERPDERDSKKVDQKPPRRNRWDDRGNEGGKRDDGDGDRGSSHSRSSDRDKRSRSRSPFRKSYLDCANPSKDELRRDEVANHSIPKTQSSQPGSFRKHSSGWSDSSDEDDRSGKSKANIASLEYGKSSQSHYNDERKHEVSSTVQIGNEELGSSSSTGISLKLGGSSVKPTPLPKVISVSRPVKSVKVAAIFNTSDSDDEPEEMPPECKMRMKNVGRETKTSEGPNSFGKTKIGFCNMSHLAEKQLDGKTASNKKA